jgi:hypothetical protein
MRCMQDIDLRRGKTLYLNAQRYESLRQLWVTNAIEHDSRVLASTLLEQAPHAHGDDFADFFEF